MSITILKDANNNDLDSGIVAIHAALIPTMTGAAIVYFGTEDQARLYDLENPGSNPVQLGTKPGWWAFCAGHAFLNDGRWVVAGGVVDQNVEHFGEAHHDSGEHRCEIYHPLEGAFEPIKDLRFQPDAQHGGGRWYPTCLTLSNGEVFAVAGHPFSGRKVLNPAWDENQPDPNDPPQWIDDTTGHDDYHFPGDNLPRHNNNTPERYSPTRDQWTLLVNESTSHNNFDIDEYPRLHLDPSGLVFFSTIAKDSLRFYDAFTGAYDGTVVAGGSPDYHTAPAGSGVTSVVLPILPGDLKKVWVLACAAANAEKINIAAAPPTWESAGTPPLGKKRPNACAVLLPTGSVFVNGGEVVNEDQDGNDLSEQELDAQNRPPAELYHPPINWSQLTYENGPGTWEAVDTPLVRRGYHSVQLLMPDGRVWIAGSTWSNWKQNEHRMEVYTPPYVTSGRVEIAEAPPSAAYGGIIDLELESSTARPITRAVLIRCGSITHAFDSDQRYVVCQFQQSSNLQRVQVRAPDGPGIAPPGNYMLFLLDDQEIDGHGRPCVRAPILRICDQECIPVNNVSTYSKLTVDALKSGGIATFQDAVWLFLENFRPHEADYPAAPDVVIRWDSPNGPAVASNLFDLAWQNPWSENNSLRPDVAQRFALRYHVGVHEDVYDEVNVERDLFVTWQFPHFECVTSLRLTTKPNPFMIDVQGGNPHWLSTDLRVFAVRAGDTPPAGAPALGTNEAPLDYLAKALEQYNDPVNAADNPFDDLDKGQETSAIELRGKVGNRRVYNFAIARVRYVAQGQDADDVRVFFRMFNTVGTALEYNTDTTYRREGTGPDAVALLGHDGHELISIPFFETKRLTPGSPMTSQTADSARTLEAKGSTEFRRYFGAWLDVNQTEEHIPPYWWHDGPFPELPDPFGPESIKGLVRNYHQCVVAEVHYADDEIPDAVDPATQIPGTPANNDNLSQRNLAWVPVGNPGSAATRTAQTTFTARPSGKTPSAELMPVTVVPRGQVLRARRLKRPGPDELLFDGSGLPAGSRVTVFWPDVDVDEILMLASRRPSPVRFDRLDDHTLSFELHGAAYVPLPGGRTAPIAGLLSAELPAGITMGESYKLVVHQVSGKKRRVIGSFQLQIPVVHEPELLAGESIKLSLLRWVFGRIPEADSWRAIFERYLGEIAERVRGFGGDPESVEPSPDGDGFEGVEPAEEHTLEGKVAELQYDCFGDFTGFVFASCDARHEFKSRECAIERLAHRACVQRLRLAVTVHPTDPHRVVKISVLCG